MQNVVQNAKDGIAKNMLRTHSPILSLHCMHNLSTPISLIKTFSMSTQYNYTTPVGCYLIRCVDVYIQYILCSNSMPLRYRGGMLQQCSGPWGGGRIPSGDD